MVWPPVRGEVVCHQGGIPLHLLYIPLFHVGLKLLHIRSTDNGLETLQEHCLIVFQTTVNTLSDKGSTGVSLTLLMARVTGDKLHRSHLSECMVQQI
jgi:hypothetical protein